MCHSRPHRHFPSFHRFSDPTPRSPCRPSLLRIIARCLLASALLALPALAQPAATDPARPVPPAEAMRLYQAADRWIRDWNLPPVPEPEPAVPAAAFTLRLDGLVVGRGTALAADGSAIHAAAQRAMLMAERKLPWSHDAVGEKARREEAAKLMISLELGGTPVPVQAQTWLEFDLLFRAGDDGVAVRVGEREEAMFAGQMLTLGYSPSEAAVALLSRLSGDAAPVVRSDPKAQPAILSKERGAVFYSIRTRHLAQKRVGESPAFLFRGGRTIEAREITTASLRQLAVDLAENLGRRVTTRRIDPGASLAEPRDVTVLLGTLKLGVPPDEDPAGAFETLLAVHALRNFAEIQSVDQEARGRAAKLATELVDGLFAGAERTPVLGVEVSAALIIAATTGADARNGVPDGAWEMATLAVGGAYAPGTGWDQKVAVAARSMVALALVRLGHQNAEASLRAIYTETPAKMLVAHMPYLGWAELELAAGKPQVAAATALREMRTDVWDHQLSSRDAGEDGPDLVGGIVFTNSPQPLPTWLGLKPGAFLATMARDPRLTGSDEKLKELIRLSLLGRFARQLAVDEHAAYAASDRARAEWGMRTSVWEMRQPPEVQAVGLLAVSELVRTLDAAAAVPPETP